MVETSSAFEKFRTLSKKTKTEFEQVRRKRSVRMVKLYHTVICIICSLRLKKFSAALDHVGGEIDQIYKVR